MRGQADTFALLSRRFGSTGWEENEHVTGENQGVGRFSVTVAVASRVGSCCVPQRVSPYLENRLVAVALAD
jgi:hypothetical protein